MVENRKCSFCGGEMICVNTQDGEFTCTTCAEYANHDVLDFIEKLKTENERLKAELQQSATNCNKLKCLALHLFEKVAKNEASEWSEFCDDQFPHSGIHKCKRRKEQWLRIVKKCGDEYRKAKAELKEGKYGTI